MVYTFDDKSAPSARVTQYFEMSPLSDLYESPFAFTGTIKRVLVDISDAEFRDLVTMAKVAMAIQ